MLNCGLRFYINLLFKQYVTLHRQRGNRGVETESSLQIQQDVMSTCVWIGTEGTTTVNKMKCEKIVGLLKCKIGNFKKVNISKMIF